MSQHDQTRLWDTAILSGSILFISLLGGAVRSPAFAETIDRLVTFTPPNDDQLDQTEAGGSRDEFLCRADAAPTEAQPLVLLPLFTAPSTEQLPVPIPTQLARPNFWVHIPATSATMARVVVKDDTNFHYETTIDLTGNGETHGVVLPDTAELAESTPYTVGLRVICGPDSTSHFIVQRQVQRVMSSDDPIANPQAPLETCLAVAEPVALCEGLANIAGYGARGLWSEAIAGFIALAPDYRDNDFFQRNFDHFLDSANLAAFPSTDLTQGDPIVHLLQEDSP